MDKELLEVALRYNPDDIEINKLISCYIRNTQLYRSRLSEKLIELYGFQGGYISLKRSLELVYNSPEREVRYITIKSIQQYLSRIL